MGKFFTVEVKPEIAASKQKLGAFSDGDLIFDWTSFQVPGGAKKLLNATAVLRSGNGAEATYALALTFAKSVNFVAPNSLGTIHATANGYGYQNHIIGGCVIEETDMSPDGLDFVAVGSAGAGSRFFATSLVLNGERDGGSFDGYDTLYVGGTTIDGDANLASTVQVSTETSTSSAAIVTKTTSILPCFAVGDVLHDEDDQALGTIKTITDATNLTLEANCANVSAVNKDIYNLNPIRLVLSFEM
tara:strand:- start:650 stop:1384 length:735 start_codon:yes stop_codon:yes gene_type:complete